MFQKTSHAIFALIVFCFLSCHTQGDSVTKTSAFPRVIERAKKDKRYFIMHSGVDTLAITSIEVENRKEFTVHLDRMDSLRRVTLNNPTVLSKKQLHLFMSDSTSYTLDEPHTISFSKLAKIEFVE